MITSEEQRQLHLLLDSMIEQNEDGGKTALVDGIDGKYREITLRLEYNERQIDDVRYL